MSISSGQTIQARQAPDTSLVSAVDVVGGWLPRFAAAMQGHDARRFAALFAETAWWRDMLSFTWARRTFSDRIEMAAAFEATAPRACVTGVRLAKDRALPRRVRRNGQEVIEAWFDFDLAVGRGTGFVRLLPDADEPFNPKIWLLLTTLHTLHGGEERVGPRRPSGEKYSKINSAENWQQHREQEQAFADRDPQVIVIGAGQGGLMLAARLRQMGVDALVIDRNRRVGDNWRARYNNLTIHNELTANHFPYFKYPESWPLWLPKDMVADWLETYARGMELNVWLGTEIVESSFDESSKTWNLMLRCADGSSRRMRTRHLVAAMGVSGGRPSKPTLPGIEEFRGAVLHSSEYDTGTKWAGKRAIVVGTGNSGHDVAQDLYVSGASSVSMVQRGKTCVISLDPCARISYSIYNEGIESEDIDLMAAAIPYPLLINSYQHITKRTSEIDADLLRGLNQAGFETHVGDDATGFQLCYLRGLGGYYIDVGCSHLIIDGKIPIIRWDNVNQFTAEGLRMKDGTVHLCELVVLATGFESIQEGIRRILGDEVADRIGPVWGFDEHFNMRNMWTRTPQDGLWIMGGAILEARFQSRFLALEIKASLDGLLPARDAMPLMKTTPAANIEVQQHG